MTDHHAPTPARPAMRAITLAEALSLAHQHHTSGRLAEAEHLYDSILKVQPDNIDALHMVGLLRHQRGELEGALAHLQRVVQLAPSFAEAHSNLGTILQSQERTDEALACYRRAVALKADYHEAHNNLGIALQKLGQYAQAAVHSERSIALKPDAPDYHLNLARALDGLGRTDDAIASIRRAIALNGQYPEAHADLGTLLFRLGRFEEAAECYRQSIRSKPDVPEAHNHLGLALQNLGLYDEAEASLRTALRLKPQYADAHANLSVLLLLQGQFEEGWREFEWRNSSAAWANRARNFTQRISHVSTEAIKRGAWANRPHDFTQPLWQGEPLENRVLLLSMEFGFGDTIQFCRYVPLLAERGRIILEVQPALAGLLSQLPGVSGTVAYGDPLPPFDFYCPLMSLPHFMGTTLTSVPAAIPYLAADPAKVAKWKERLAQFRGRRVGLAWAGNPAMARDRQRSIAFDRLALLHDVPGLHFVSLQKGAATTELRTHPFGAQVHDWTGELEDFADTAALIANLDLVISVDTAVVHLAGAMGKPVWLLNRFDTCWRWLLEREDSPWYPTLRQFRQRRRGDWDEVLHGMREALLESGAGPIGSGAHDRP